MLYRIRRMQEEFAIPLDEPVKHADLLLSVSLLLFEAKGPDFFLPQLPPDTAGIKFATSCRRISAMNRRCD